jgi:hypothetical protein
MWTEFFWLITESADRFGEHSDEIIIYRKSFGIFRVADNYYFRKTEYSPRS